MAKRDKSKLDKAKKQKADEFYTQLIDIEKEMIYYETHFKNKTIYCNCDNENSNFVVFFKLNFERLGLKKLIATHYNNEKHPYKIEIFKKEGVLRKKLTTLKGNGDFRSSECIEILINSDIVITNPPFSLFREYISQLISYNKKFIILGHLNAVTYKNIFPLIKDDKIKLGISIRTGYRMFKVPPDYEIECKTFHIYSNGDKYIAINAPRWFTNIPYEYEIEQLSLTESYNDEKYPKYDNYDAIEVNKIKNIPCDYYGVMGVPITFMDKYNPDQFEILGIAAGSKDTAGIPFLGQKITHPLIKGKKMYARIFIQKKIVKK